MPALQSELHALKDNLLDMLSLVRSQMVKCRKAIHKNDLTLAEEVIDDEQKVNNQEVAIDRDCENILALYTPVANDLRSVLATLKITNDLERIGDNAKSIARFLLEENEHDQEWFKAYQLEDMLEIVIDMLKEMGEALRTEDTKLAKKTTKKDEELNALSKKAFNTTVNLIRQNPDQGKTILLLFSLTRNLERAGDLTKNIAEEIVFQIEAKVIKHKKH